MPNLLDGPMSKKKNGGDTPPPAKPQKNPANTKIDAELLRQARTIAAFRDEDLYDVLDSILRGPITEQYREIVRE